MVAIFVRTFILYALLSLSLKLMGKRQLGELEISELVSALLISEVAILPVEDPDLPLFNAVLPMLTILSLEVLVSYFKNKSQKLKDLAEGAPVYLLYKGKLRQKALADNRISVDEMMAELRVLGYGNLADVNYVILEANGKISVCPKPGCAPLTFETKSKPDGAGLSHAVVIDGEIRKERMEALGYGEDWLQKNMERQHVTQKDIFLLTVDDEGTVSVIRKEPV